MTINSIKYNTWIDYDRQHVWHPYSAIGADLPVYPVVSAQGVRLHLVSPPNMTWDMS